MCLNLTKKKWKQKQWHKKHIAHKPKNVQLLKTESMQYYVKTSITFNTFIWNLLNLHAIESFAEIFFCLLLLLYVQIHSLIQRSILNGKKRNQTKWNRPNLHRRLFVIQTNFHIRKMWYHFKNDYQLEFYTN